MIKDQLVEFEHISKKRAAKWQNLLKIIDIIPIIIIVTIWLYRFIERYIKYNGQLFQEIDFTVLIILIFPVLFWYLYSRNLKFGWFLRSAFHLFIVTIIIRWFFSKSNNDLVALITFSLILTASTTIVFTSFAKKNLQRLKIDNIILVFSLIVDLGIILLASMY